MGGNTRVLSCCDKVTLSQLLRRTGFCEEPGKLLALIRLGCLVVDGTVKLNELLLNVVNSGKLKVLICFDQKVSSQVSPLVFGVTRMLCYWRKGRT